MSSAETPSNNKRISLSNSFSDDQGYHGSGAEHEDSLSRKVERLKHEKLELLKQNLVGLSVIQVPPA